MTACAADVVVKFLLGNAFRSPAPQLEKHGEPVDDSAGLPSIFLPQKLINIFSLHICNVFILITYL